MDMRLILICSADLDKGLWAHFLLVEIEILLTGKNTESL